MLSWCSVDAHFEQLQYRHTRYCLYRLPILWLWVNAVAQPLDYTRCNTLNCGRSVDAHFQTGHMTMLRSLLLITAAISLNLGKCCSAVLGLYKMQHPSLLTLCWRSVDALWTLCWRSVDALLTLCWRSVDALLTLCWRSVDALLTLCWRSVDALLTVIFRMRLLLFRLLSYLERQPICWLSITASKSLSN